MATRLYLHSAGTPDITPGFNATWEQTGQAVVLPMDTTPRSRLSALTNSAAITVPITTTQQILCYQFVSQLFKPVKLDVTDVFSMVIRGFENATTNNVFLAYTLRTWTDDGTSPILFSMTNAGTAFAATAETRTFSGIALPSTILLKPWRLLLEVGGHGQAPAAAGSFTLRAGNSAGSDFALTDALTTDLNPWIELSRDLDVLPFNNYQQVRVGGGMGCSERIR